MSVVLFMDETRDPERRRSDSPASAVERSVHVEVARCPFCHESLRHEDAKIGCAGCMAWHHAECWGENADRCATCGLRTTHAPPATRTPKTTPSVARALATMERAAAERRATPLFSGPLPIEGYERMAARKRVAVLVGVIANVCIGLAALRAFGAAAVLAGVVFFALVLVLVLRRTWRGDA